MIKSIIFDWGGVLIDNPAERLIDFCASSLGITPDKLRSEFSKFEARFQKGTILETEIWTSICNNIHIEKPACPSLWRDAVNNVFRDKKSVYNLAKRLRTNGYKIGFLSNTELPTMEYFYDNKYDKYFDALIFSCIESCIKPEVKIFNIALERLGTGPQETIFIDDKKEYTKAATQLGINSIVFRSYDDLIKKLKSLGVNTG